MKSSLSFFPLLFSQLGRKRWWCVSSTWFSSICFCLFRYFLDWLMVMMLASWRIITTKRSAAAARRDWSISTEGEWMMLLSFEIIQIHELHFQSLRHCVHAASKQHPIWSYTKIKLTWRLTFRPLKQVVWHRDKMGMLWNALECRRTHILYRLDCNTWW